MKEITPKCNIRYMHDFPDHPCKKCSPKEWKLKKGRKNMECKHDWFCAGIAKEHNMWIYFFWCKKCLLTRSIGDMNS